MTISHQNWSEHVPFQAAGYHAPATIGELQEIVRRADHVGIVGSGHSFNDMADTTGEMISLARLDKGIMIDPEGQTVTVNAGITYSELCPQLHQAGYALANMASLPHITVLGACATATHGSGDGIGNLATAVAGLEIVRGDGELITLTRERDGEQFLGAVVGLGALGVVTKVTLDLLPAFTMQQAVYERLSMSAVDAHFDEIMGSAYSVSLFTDWQNGEVNQLWRKHFLPDGEPLPVDPTYLGATLATANHHPVDDRSAEPCTIQMGIPGPWYERLPHFHIRSILTGGNELQTEYFVARDDAVKAIRAVEALQPQMASFLVLSEVRSIAADQLWLSPAYGQDCIGLHFSWFKKWPEIAQFLPVLEASLAPFQARPHWGKLFTMTRKQIHRLYEKMGDFQALRNEMDPAGKFRNPYLDAYIL